MKLLNLLLAILLLTIGTKSSLALVLSVTNHASGTPGGNRFDNEIGANYSLSVLADAASFIWSTFAENDESQRKDIQLITLTITSLADNNVAETSNNAISMNSDYLAGYSGDVKTEFTGVMYHEETHVWQWAGSGSPGGLIEGVADYVRLKAGYAPGHWVKPGQGDRWDQGYDVTARFLDYCDSLQNGFVAELNAKMKDAYSDAFFQDLLGKTVDELWNDYKAKYSGTN